MPIYEYKCKNGHTFEEYHSIADRYNAVCPKCKRPAHIKISISSFKIKSSANQMALDSLNSPNGGFPDGPMKAAGQAGVARGLERPPKTIW